MEGLKKAVVCPVFNEGETWRGVCLELAGIFDLVVVVDDGSTQPVADPGMQNLVVLRHPRNLGKGRALETGFRYCLERGFGYVATVDGDGEHVPANFDRALAICAGYDLVNLSRAPFFGVYGPLRRYRNILISGQISRSLGLRVQDTQSGMRVFSAQALRTVLSGGVSPGYAVETTMLKRVRQAGYAIKEIPMEEFGLIRGRRRYANRAVCLDDFWSFLGAFFVSSRPSPSARSGHPHGVQRLSKPRRNLAQR